MADRIVVMNHGVVEQVGAPVEVYMRPRSPFVARFVGQMNFLEAVAGERAGWARLGAAEMRHGATEPIAAGTRLTLAIRPEEITVGAAVGAENRLVTRIRAVQFLGAFTRLSLALARRRARARVRRGGHRVRRAWAPPRAPSWRSRSGPRPCASSRPRASVGWRRARDVAAAIPDRMVRHRLAGEDLVRYALVAVFAIVLYLFVLYPLLHVIWRSLLDNDGGFVGLANYRRYFGTPAIAASIRNSLSVSLVSMVITVALAFGYAYGLTRTLMPCRGLFRDRGDAAALRALPGAGARLHLRLRQQRHLHPRHRLQRGHLRRQGHRGGRGVLLLPARAPHPGGRALRHRRAPLRRGADARRLPAQDLPDRDPARREVRARERLLRGLHPRHHRLRRAQGHRRQVLGDGHRDLQPGLRPAELHHGRHRLGGPADPGGARLPGGPPGPAPPVRAGDLVLAPARAGPPPARRLGRLRLLRAHRGAPSPGIYLAIAVYSLVARWPYNFTPDPQATTASTRSAATRRSGTACTWPR